MSDDPLRIPVLPLDVLGDILSRLPVKSLLRFRGVSRSWRFHIESPDFINSHLNQSKKITNFHTQKLLLLRYFTPNPKTEQFLLRLDSPSLDMYASFRFPLKTKDYFFRVVGSCNGLICLSNDFFRNNVNVILWNPMIKRYLMVRLPEKFGTFMSVLGFGSNVRNDCKIVRLAYPWNPALGIYEATPEVEVYAVSTGSWKKIIDGVPSYNIAQSTWSQVFFKGCVHWFAYKSENHRFHHVILVFDLTEEVFRVMGVPDVLAPVLPARFSIGLYKDLIALFLHDMPGNCARCMVVVMKEYGKVGSWEKLFIVDVRGGIGSVLGFRQNGEVILETRNGELVSCDDRMKNIQKLWICGAKDSLYGGSYSDSLVFLDGLNGRVKSYDEVDCWKGTQEVEISEDVLYHATMARHIGAAESVTPLCRGHDD